MANLKNYYPKKTYLRLNTDEYWDFYLSLNENTPYDILKNGDVMYDKNLISYIDMSCVKDDWLYGDERYTWDGANVSEYTLYNIGYTGLDNGLIPFRRDIIDNKQFVEIYSNSRYDIISDNNVLKLHKISGGTTQYDYPVTVMGDKIKLNGGFYQGFFKTQCDKYMILPDRIESGEEWNFQFVLNKTEFEKESNKTLNDKYPDNKGIFFYIGTRAENKWVYLYDDKEDECFSLSYDDYIEDAHVDKKTYKINAFTDMSVDMGFIETPFYKSEIFDIDFHETLNEVNVKMYTSKDCIIFGDDYLLDIESVNCDVEYIEDDLDISDFIYETNSGLKLHINGEYYFETDNKFLMFDRTCNGFTVKNWEEGSVMRYYGVRNNFKGNLFLLMNRTCTGYTVNTIDEYRDSFKEEYNIYNDLYNNALCFRITDNGEIGYRYLMCDSEAENNLFIKEAYSLPGIIKENEWYSINVKIQAFNDKMKLYFYVNGYLKFISDELPKLNLRELKEISEKQETVPFNISLGGGTQGLAETILPNYMLDAYRVYPLEKNFAGSFIGYIKSFKFYNGKLESLNILNNSKYDLKQ